VRIFGAEDSVHARGTCLQPQGLDVMSAGHQVGFRRQIISRVTPVGVAEGPQLAAIDKGLQTLLHLLEVGRAAMRGVADVVGQSSRFDRISR
jgi:hypothetical protein